MKINQLTGSSKLDSTEAVWLDNQEVMQALKISYRTLCRFRQEGIIPARRIRGKFYYKESDIAKFWTAGTLNAYNLRVNR